MKMNETRNIIIEEVWYVPTSDVNSIGLLGGKDVVTLKSGKDWLKVYFTPGTASLEEDPIREGRADAFTQRFVMSLPGEDEDTREWIDEVDNRPVLLKLVQNNGVKLLGSMAVPCRMKIGYSLTGSGMNVRVERRSTDRVRWMEE